MVIMVVGSVMVILVIVVIGSNAPANSLTTSSLAASSLTGAAPFWGAAPSREWPCRSNLIPGSGPVWGAAS